MPNHVDQDLWVTGDTVTLKEFLEFAKEGAYTLSANKFIPYPIQYALADKLAQEHYKAGNTSFKDGFNSGGYQWCLKNWGTKWGIYDCSVVSQKLDSKKGRLKFNFNSAWSPALLIVGAMSKKFPTLKFKLKYYEAGMGFKGTSIFTGGESLESVEEEYKGGRGG